MSDTQERIIQKVISGGQTGVDRAALDVALATDLPVGGWCPKGRLAEDGPIPAHYPLQEIDSPAYARRTEQNVIEGDGTLILATHKNLKGGTALTLHLAQKQAKPHLVVNLLDQPDVRVIQQWLLKEHIHVLNVAGPRESASPGIYQHARALLEELFACAAEGTNPAGAQTLR